MLWFTLSTALEASSIIAYIIVDQSICVYTRVVVCCRLIKDPELLMNLALFDKLCMQCQNSILFVKFTATSSHYMDGNRRGCSWLFYKQGKPIARVPCFLTEKNITMTTVSCLVE